MEFIFIRIIIISAILIYLPYYFPFLLLYWFCVFLYKQYQKRKAKKRYNRAIAEHGQPRNAIRFDRSFMLFYQQEMLVNEQVIPYAKIISTRVPHELSARETDNGNMFWRALVGLFFFGDGGDVVGAVTSRTVSKEYKKDKGRYHLIVNVADFDSSTIHVLVKDREKFEEIRSCINIILDANIKKSNPLALDK